MIFLETYTAWNIHLKYLMEKSLQGSWNSYYIQFGWRISKCILEATPTYHIIRPTGISNISQSVNTQDCGKIHLTRSPRHLNFHGKENQKRKRVKKFIPSSEYFSIFERERKRKKKKINIFLSNFIIYLYIYLYSLF